MTQAATGPEAITHAAGMTIPVSPELQKILERADKKTSAEDSVELRNLLTGELLLDKLTPEVMATKGHIEAAILMARGLEYLRSILTQGIVERFFLPLQNNPRGFLTDRKPDKNDPGGYVWWIVRDCLIDAFSRGLPVIGNHFNIISERMYITRNGMTYLLQHLPGLTDLRITPGVPELTDLGGLVEVTGSWLLNGRSDSMTQTIAVRVNKGQGADAILGKADRKFKAALYGRLTGTVFTEEGELDDSEGAAGATAAPKRRSKAQEVLDGLPDPAKYTVGVDPAKPGADQSVEIRVVGEGPGWTAVQVPATPSPIETVRPTPEPTKAETPQAASTGSLNLPNLNLFRTGNPVP